MVGQSNRIKLNLSSIICEVKQIYFDTKCQTQQLEMFHYTELDYIMYPLWATIRTTIFYSLVHKTLFGTLKLGY